jgi:hypothetical protein
VQQKSVQYAKMSVVPANQSESDIPTKEQLHKAVISITNSDGEEQKVRVAYTLPINFSLP